VALKTTESVLRDLSKLCLSSLPVVLAHFVFMSVIVGFEVDQHVASPGKRPLDKQTSALSMALSSPRSCDSSASQRSKPAAFYCSDQRSDDAEDTMSCYSDEDDDDEELPSSSQSSMPIPRPSSRCDIDQHILLL
jgi:hypothetical protein